MAGQPAAEQEPSPLTEDPAPLLLRPLLRRHLPEPANPYQRAALIVARWSGARRDGIRRLAVDCLDAYPDGHPRLRIPVGKDYTERSIPLHPQAADALQPLIDQARAQGGRRRYDPSAGREVQHIFVVRGKLLSKSLLFDMALAEACTAAGLVDSAGRATITAHRFRHTIGTQLAEGGARIQTIMAVLGHRTPIIYASLSDPTVKQQYQDALDRQLGLTSPWPDPPRRRCVTTIWTPKRCPGSKPTSSRPNSSSATACASRPKDSRGASALVVRNFEQVRTRSHSHDTRPPGRGTATHRRCNQPRMGP